MFTRKTVLNSAIAILVSSAVLLSPLKTYADSKLFLPVVANSGNSFQGTIPNVESDPEESDPVSTGNGYLTLSLDIAHQLTIGKAIDYVGKPATATQKNYNDVTASFPQIAGVDQMSVHEFTTGVKDKPCLQAIVRKYTTTILTIACFPSFDSNHSYPDVVTVISANVNTLP